MSMRSLASLSLSGGQGKTTVSFLTALSLAEQGFKVLAVDCDPQANLTLYCRHFVESSEPTLLEALTGSVDTADAVYETNHKNLFLIPADDGLERAKDYLASTGMAATVLRGTLAPIAKAFDFCVIDSPPQRNQICITVAGAADRVVIPAEAVTKGARSLQRTIDMLEGLERLGGLKNPLKTTILCTIPFRNKCVGFNQTVQSRDAIGAMEVIADGFGIPVFPALPESEKFKTAVDRGQTLETLGHPELALGLKNIVSTLQGV